MVRRGFETVSYYLCCRGSMETINHLFINGPVAYGIWQFFRSQFNITMSDTTSIDHLLHFRSSSTAYKSQIRCILPLFVLWIIWIARNDVKHRGIQMRHTRIIANILQHINRAQTTRSLGKMVWKGDSNVAIAWGFQLFTFSKNIVKIVRWIKPPQGWIKLNYDGASRGDPVLAGVGGIARDHTSSPLFAFCAALRNQTNIYAKLYVLVEGLVLYHQRALYKVWVEIDASIYLQSYEWFQKISIYDFHTY
ncbi:hypothetical protein Pfo_026727 [Paulownia fortunei]|nr:hypothetical protein Pfo_026727 [Paulownia fortunei]